MGWRMGQGEDVKWEFYKAYSLASLSEREAIKDAYPEPDDWQGFYAEIEASPYQGS